MADRFDEIAKEFWEDMGSDDGGAGISNLAERIRGLCEANTTVRIRELEAALAVKDAALEKVYNGIIPAKSFLKLVGEHGVGRYGTQAGCVQSAKELADLQELIRAALTEVEK